jgi:L-fuculose-phosphate aldolase
MPSTLTLPKQALMDRARQGMQTQLAQMPAWSIREKLALTCRILFDAGHDSGLAGQITSRAEQPGTFYTQRLGLGFDEISASNLLRVDEDLNLVEGSGMPNPANRFHTWIYRQRPDVQCIIHTHPFHASTLSMLEEPLAISHMDTCALYGDCGFLPQWPGVPVGNEEGQRIAEALGSKRAVLLAHHGLLVAGAGIEEACMLAMLFEKAAKMQLAASAAGTIRPIPEALGREAHDWILAPKRTEATFFYYARRVLKNGSDCLE